MSSPSLDPLLTETLDHFASKVVNRLHFCGLECQFAHLGPLSKNTKKEVK